MSALLNNIEKFCELKTPFYVYDLDRLVHSISACTKAAKLRGFQVHYALKANSDLRILNLMLEAGLGADCVSGAEVNRALKVGFKPSSIAFAGVGKTDEEIDLAIEQGIFSINVESIEELEVIDGRAKIIGKPANIALRLNPDVDPKTHHFITTGLEENKFGISSHQVDHAMEILRNSEHLKLKGLHFHIGSQIQSLEPFRNLCNRVNAFQDYFEEHGFLIEHVNLGGGLGVNYLEPDDLAQPNFEAFFALFEEFLEPRPAQQIHFELGRSLVANCGSLISRVLFVKKALKTQFVILDAGMTELIRPALYQALHKIDNLSNAKTSELELYDVVGPVCESSDCFGKAISLPKTKRGDILAIRSAGAYGEVMASNYNLRRLNSTVYLSQGRAQVQ